MLTLLKSIGLPGSLDFLAVCCAIGLAMRVAGRRRLARAWLLTVYVTYLVGGLPALAQFAAARVPADPALSDFSALRGADALVVLDGDNARARARHAVSLFQALAPKVVVISGNDAFVRHLRRLGIPERGLTIDTVSPTTRAQIGLVGDMMRGGRFQRPVLVASRLSTPRIRALLQSAHLDSVLLAPSPLDVEPPAGGAGLFVPRHAAMLMTRDSLYELLARRYYRMEGWVE